MSNSWVLVCDKLRISKSKNWTFFPFSVQAILILIFTMETVSQRQVSVMQPTCSIYKKFEGSFSKLSKERVKKYHLSFFFSPRIGIKKRKKSEFMFDDLWEEGHLKEFISAGFQSVRSCKCFHILLLLWSYIPWKHHPPATQ